MNLDIVIVSEVTMESVRITRLLFIMNKWSCLRPKKIGLLYKNDFVTENNVSLPTFLNGNRKADRQMLPHLLIDFHWIACVTISLFCYQDCIDDKRTMTLTWIKAMQLTITILYNFRHLVENECVSWMEILVLKN